MRSLHESVKALVDAGAKDHAGRGQGRLVKQVPLTRRWALGPKVDVAEVAGALDCERSRGPAE